MMSMQELFYGDREPTWIIPSYPQYEQVVPRTAVYYQQQQQEPHHVYYQDAASARYRSQYQRRSPLLPYTQTRYTASSPGVVETRYKLSSDGNQVVDLMVPMCCTKCEEKVKEALLEMEGVEGVKTDQDNHRVTVSGYVNPMRVLKRVKKIKKRSEFITIPWIVPYQQHLHVTSYKSAKPYSRYPQSSQVHTQQYYNYNYPDDFRAREEFNYPHNFYAPGSHCHH